MPISGYFDVPFCSSGSKATVPDAVQVDGSVSYTQGYGVNYTLEPGVDPAALDIEQTKMNQLFYDITSSIQQVQQESVPPFITTTMNGGTPYSYNKGVRVISGGVIYESVASANTDTPPTSNWITVGNGTPLLAANNFSDLASLSTALTNLGFTTTSGYVKLPGGVIIQWGTFTTNGSGIAAVTFPLTFPTGIYALSALPNSSTAAASYSASYDGGTLTASGVTFNGSQINSVLSFQALYIAIGH